MLWRDGCVGGDINTHPCESALLFFDGQQSVVLSGGEDPRDTHYRYLQIIDNALCREVKLNDANNSGAVRALCKG
jgi:hypothetical protein